MIDNNGNRTKTYYAVQQVNKELSPIADLYGKYENVGAVIYNRLNPFAAGAKLGLTKVEKQYKPEVATAAPLLCGCFTEKNGIGGAYVFTNMFEPQTGMAAPFTAVFTGAESITVYRKGIKHVIEGSTLTMTLENREGVFVTVDYGENTSRPVC